MVRKSISLPEDHAEFIEKQIEERPEFDPETGFSRFLQYLVRKERREVEGRKREKQPK